MLIFDIETDGLIASTIHCLVILRVKDAKIFRFTPSNINEGVLLLQKEIDDGGSICGHNIIKYDIPVIQKLYPHFQVKKEQVLDTLVMSRLIYSNLEMIDLGLMKKEILPSKLYKSYSLKAFGCRLGELKGTYAEENENAWDSFNEDMLNYCEQDVKVTLKLYQKLLSKEYSEQALRLEHDVAWLCAQMERNGFSFDIKKAEKLQGVLQIRKAELSDILNKQAPQIPDKVFIPKRDNKTLGYKKGVPIQRYKIFNPSSRQHIDYILKEKYNYFPRDESLYEISSDNTKRLKIDEGLFSYMLDDDDCPQELKELSKLLAENLMLQKRLGQLSEGKNAWIKYYNKEDTCIHGVVVTNGAVSGRATHNSPNIAQVPHIGSPYGKECRELWKPKEGWIQCGIDVSGLELRCLAHYLYPYDKGTYADIVLNGDIHSANQKAAGLAERNQAKTFIYAFLYGAGDEKIGKIIGGSAKDGKRIKRKFLKATPAIKSLRTAIEDSLKTRTYLFGLDKRLLHVRSTHSALNLLLQGAGAIICKHWIVRTEERLLARGLKHGWNGDFAYMAWVHDEIQLGCRNQEVADIVIEETQLAIRDTQAYFNIKIQLDVEGKSGANWAECH